MNPIDLILNPLVTSWIACILDQDNYDHNNKIFYYQVCANIVAMTLKKSLDLRTYKALALQKQLYTFRDQDNNKKKDSLIMLYLLLAKIDPSTSIRIESYCMTIEK